MSTDTQPMMLDSLASFARTALDDPDGLHDPPRWDGNLSYSSYTMRSADLHAYAIHRLDEIIEALNPSTEDRKTFAESLTVLGRHLEDRRERIEALIPDTEEPDTAAYREANEALGLALDHIDTARGALKPGQWEDE